MKLLAGWLAGLLIVMLVPSLAAAVSLDNDRWHVEVDPATLAIRVTPKGLSPLEVSRGVSEHAVDNLHSTLGQAQWRWDEGAYEVSVRLQGSDLIFSIKAREPGTLALLRQPAEAMGKALILPLAEGHYIPSNDPLWRSFLLDNLNVINTSQDLSLPLWGLDQGRYSLHWLLGNPFNNQLTFSAVEAGVEMALNHEFTPLALDTPMTFSLHLAGSDPLAGARRYRQWRVDQGQYETLAQKIVRSPEAAKILGAAHVYLWGNGLLGVKDVQSWPLLLSRLRAEHGPVQAWVETFDGESRRLLETMSAAPSVYERQALVRALNGAFDKQARNGWQNTDVEATVLAEGYARVREEVAAVLGAALVAGSEQWGTLSPALFDTLANAGLERLWLGLGDGWEGGLWHPQAIAAAVAKGYLIAPYDSYETALPVGVNPNWATANLGSITHRKCGILLADGSLKSGFNGLGYYTNPTCVRPVLEARISAIQAKAGFNSWFLDAYGAGMLMDDYRPGAELSMARQATKQEEAFRWITDVRQLPSGTEDGNATTAGGILFAHGMQTPVIGWGDPGMYKDKDAAQYLGNWWPEEAPSVFFKPVEIQEPFRTVHFSSLTRLPLYQTVFHGSVITSHHWGMDSLKLTNVRVDNELTQLLYNVPPLYHLSTLNVKGRLPFMVRQDQFFRPLHQRLATQSLKGFQWLTADRQVQQTTFEDGTRLIANFSDTPFSVDNVMVAGRSISARIPGEVPRDYTPTAP